MPEIGLVGFSLYIHEDYRFVEGACFYDWGLKGVLRGLESGRKMWMTDYKDASVLITGHTGFKGSWLCLWLQRLGARVYGLAQPPETVPNLFEEARVAESLEKSFVGDIRDRQLVREVLDESKPDFVFHLAAQPLVRRSYSLPADTFTINFNGTLNLLESLRSRAKPCIGVMITTDKVYRNVEWVWGYRECDPLGGDDPYSASKAACEMVVHSYQKSFFGEGTGIRTVSARGGNVVGGGDWSEGRIIPDLVRALAEESALEVRSPSSVRPWQHVLDLLSGYLRLASRLKRNPIEDGERAWNFGPHTGDDMKVGQLVDLFLRVWGSGSWKDISRGKHLHEANILRLAIDKSVGELGWKPTWRTVQAVERTADWYRNHLHGVSARELVERDIELFEAEIDF